MPGCPLGRFVPRAAILPKSAKGEFRIILLQINLRRVLLTTGSLLSQGHFELSIKTASFNRPNG